MDSPFDVLLIEPDADEEEIRRAYRRRAKETHPDQGGSVEEFRAVKRAYATITSGRHENGAGAVPGTDGHRENGHREDGHADAGHDDYAVPESCRVRYLDYEVLADRGWRLDDEDLFEKAADADLDGTDYGEFDVESGEFLLDAAERGGLQWPFACRGGACANCAVAVVRGELTQPGDHILPPEVTERGIRLSCNGTPITDELDVVYNVKHRPDLDDLRLPPYPFEQAYSRK